MTTQERIDAVREAFPTVKRLCDTRNATNEAVIKALLGDKYKPNGLNLISFAMMDEFERTNHPAVTANKKARKDIEDYLRTLPEPVASAMLIIMYIGRENDCLARIDPYRYFEIYEKDLDKNVFDFTVENLKTKSPCLAIYLQTGLQLLLGN